MNRPLRLERPQLLTDMVVERIRAAIVNGEFGLGSQMSEAQLAQQLGVSKTPVREALLRLAAEGFIDVAPKSGWTVRALDFARFEHLYDLRIVLEQAAARKLCSADHVDALSGLKRTWLVPAKARLSDWIAVSRIDEAFHATLVAAAGNPEMARVHAEVTERIRIVRRLDFTQAERVGATYDEHAAILKAILARKPQQATLLLSAHIEQSKLEVRKISIHRLHEAHHSARRQP